MSGTTNPMPVAAITVVRTAVAAFAAVIGGHCAELTLSKPTAAPGSSVLVPVSFASQSSSAAGIQFDLQYDSSVLSLSATVGDAARSSGKALYLLDLAPGQRRFLIIGLNGTPVIDGTLINLFVSLSPSASGGTYPLKVLNVVGADSSAHAVTVRTVDGSITIQGTSGSASRVQPAGVLNGASLLPGPVAPGEFVTLIGAGIGPASPQVPTASPASTVLDGTAVMFDGTPAPLVFAAPSQINAIAPYGIQNRASTQVQVTQRGQTVADLLIPVADASPALFTMDGSGVGQAAVLNQDSTVNSPSNPAEKGSTIVLFATGAGQTVPPGTDGLIAGDTLSKPLLPVSVMIGGLDAKVQYAGSAPGLVAGVLQVNCTVPLDSPSGYAVPILLYVGKTGSPAGATVATR